MTTTSHRIERSADGVVKVLGPRLVKHFDPETLKDPQLLVLNAARFAAAVGAATWTADPRQPHDGTLVLATIDATTPVISHRVDGDQKDEAALTATAERLAATFPDASVRARTSPGIPFDAWCVSVSWKDGPTVMTMVDRVADVLGGAPTPMSFDRHTDWLGFVSAALDELEDPSVPGGLYDPLTRLHATDVGYDPHAQLICERFHATGSGYTRANLLDATTRSGGRDVLEAELRLFNR
jgi:hypothetical protein